MKRIAKSFFYAIVSPIKTIGLIFVKLIGVPAYRAIFFVRRFANRVLLPAKHRFFYLLSNKYSIHIFMVFLVCVVGFGNVQTQNVRAETFGQKSYLYALVTPDNPDEVEVIKAEETVFVDESSSSYFSDTAADRRRLVDQDLQNEASSPQGSIVPPTSRTRTETYTVREGDTLGKISVRFQLSISTLLSVNGLTLQSTIRPGDTLKILPEDGILYTVKRGDTLSKIANTYHVDVSDIVSANPAIATTLQVGSEILLPGATESISSAIARKQVSVKDLFVEPKTKAEVNRSKQTSVSRAGWVWPATHRVITQYYSWKHTGIDVDGDYSTFSVAAHDGVVSYTGWRNGYGLTVEVDHGNGLKTRYAHNAKILVNTGDIVSAGEHVAQTGSTGNSTGTHLHFEVIVNGRFQNPLSYVR